MPTSRRRAADAAPDGNPSGAGAPVQREARALGDPTRHALFRLIDEGTEPSTVTALAERLGLHVSAVRQHLAKLIEAGLVVEDAPQPSPTGRGRPPARYRSAPAVLGRWGTESPYERLALLLMEVVRSGRTPREVGEEAGRLVVRRDATAGADPAERLGAVAAQLGFEPRRIPRAGGCALVLDRCPYAAAAAADPVVCELHLGLAEGIAAEVGGLTVDGLRRKDPYRGGCRIDLSFRQ